MYQQQRTRSSGITMIELLTVMFIGSAVMVAVTQFTALGFPVSRMTYQQAQSNEMARVQMRRIIRALREVRQAETGAYAILEAEPHRLVFYADVDGDGLAERIRYELVGTSLERGVIVPTGDPLTYVAENETVAVTAVHIHNGDDPLFVYFDGNYPSSLDPLDPVNVTEVRYVELLLRVDTDPINDPPAIELRSQVHLRNLKTNLGDT